MPRVCLVCSHPDRAAIDRAMVRGEVLLRLGALYRLSKDSLTKHKAPHPPEGLTKARVIEEETHADSLLAQLLTLRDQASELYELARSKGDVRTALAGIREIRSTLELLAEVAGRLDRRPQVNLLVSPEWLLVRSTLLDALRGYPEARLAVVECLLALESGNGQNTKHIA